MRTLSVFFLAVGFVSAATAQPTPAANQAAIDRVLALQAPVSRKADELFKLADAALKAADRAQARKALEPATLLAGLDDGRMADACSRLAGVCLWQRDFPAAREALDKALALKGLTPEQRLAVRLRSAGLRGAEGDLDGMRNDLTGAEKSATDDKLGPDKLLHAYREAAGEFLVSQQDVVVREMLGRADAILAATVPRQTKVYECRFMDRPPLGGAGWAQSDLIRDPSYKESRFEPYDQKSAEQLILDATVQRAVQAPQPAGPRRETAFFMAADAEGWHIYVQSGDPEIRQRLESGEAKDDALEMFFCPGLERESYHQWIIGLATGKVDHYNWDTPHPGYLPLDAYFKTETLTLPDGWGTYIFIPWECLYDKLPLEGEQWRFSLMRWMPGAVTWGGQVHETGRFGLVHFAPPTAEQRAAIQRSLIRKAWLRYRDKERAVSDFWKDRERGDPGFYTAALEPVIKRHNVVGDRLKDLEKLDAAALGTVYREVPGLMEFEYEAQGLRREFLTGNLAK
jgi:hypothetical protein